MSPLTLLINPPLPVMVAALIALLVFALTALLSKKATERLAKGQGEPSGVRRAFTGFTQSANGVRLHYCHIFASAA